MRLLITLLTVCLLAACGGGGSQQTAVGADGSLGILPTQRSLIFAYPSPGQSDVSPTAPIILRFSHPLLTPTPAAIVAHFSIVNVDTNQVVPFTASVTSDLQALTLTPTQLLHENSHYRIHTDNSDIVSLVPGDVTLPVVQFTTRPSVSGPRLAQNAAGSTGFQVIGQLPDPTQYSVVDFTTFRLQFSQPIDSSTVIYGSSVHLRAAGSTTDIPARVLVSGNHLTIDPDDVPDPSDAQGLLLKSSLVAGTTYTLQLSTAIKSSFGDNLVPGAYANYTFTPQSTAPASNMAVQAPNAAGVQSILTGSVFNQVPVVSNLLGNQTAAGAEGLLGVDLAYTPSFPNAVPVRVRRGSLLSGSGLNVLIGGQVPVNLNTGTITVSMISDANGTLTPNPYSNSPFAPRLVALQLDVAVSAAQNSSNGAFTQNILHVNTYGVSIVKNGQLIIDAVGVVELKVLGTDNATALLALHLEGFADQLHAPRAGADTIAPVIQSRVPNLGGDGLVRPGDPILVNFSEAMDTRSLLANGAVVVTKQSEGASSAQPVAFTQDLDGVSLIIRPLTPLEYGATYTVSIGAGSASPTDLAGNAMTAQTFSFTVPRLVNKLSTDATVRPPIVLSIYPGFPCPIDSTTRNVANNVQGQCLGGKSTDDLLPIPTIEASRDIMATFSQSVNPASLKLATSCSGSGSIRVEQINSSGACTAVVPGRLLTSNPRELDFKPDNAWAVGQLYHIVLNSNGSNTSSAATCDGSQAICGSNGLPLQTQLISQTLATVSNPQRGGPAMDVYFLGGPNLTSTPVGLRLLPNYDVDANFIYQQPVLGYSGTQAEQSPDVDPSTGNVSIPNGARIRPDRTQGNLVSTQPYNTQFTKPAASGAAVDLSVGCSLAQRTLESDSNGYEIATGQCAKGELLSATSSLLASLGTYDSTLGGVKVLINPGLVVASQAYLYGQLQVNLNAINGGALGPLTSLVPAALANIINQVINGILPPQLITLPQPIPTGPLVLRIRYNAGQPIVGVLTAGPNGGNPILSTTLNLYLDIPEVNAKAYIGASPPGAGIPLQLDHTARSLSLPNIKVTGQTSFLPDGRLTVALKNTVPIYIQAGIFDTIVPNVPLVGGTIYAIAIPGDFSLNATLAPLKK